eukprot:scaffold82021_cov23-Tisochrysis_lutea.AAC.1
MQLSLQIHPDKCLHKVRAHMCRGVCTVCKPELQGCKACTANPACEALWGVMCPLEVRRSFKYGKHQQGVRLAQLVPQASSVACGSTAAAALDHQPAVGQPLVLLPSAREYSTKHF